MRNTILCAGLLLAAVIIPAGCVRVNAKAPQDIPWYSPAPTASIPQADPAGKDDLLRENRQLRERITWLDKQNRKSAKKYSELQADKREIQAEMAKIAAQRDRYLRAAGR